MRNGQIRRDKTRFASGNILIVKSFSRLGFPSPPKEKKHNAYIVEKITFYIIILKSL